MNGDSQPSPPHAADSARSARPVLFLDQLFDAQSLYQLRSAVAAHTAELGVPARQAHDILIAVHELASNTIRHGLGHGRLSGWTTQRLLIWTIADGERPGDLAPPAALDRTPADSPNLPWPVVPGHGLWLVGRVADRLIVHCADGIVSATVSFTHQSLA